MALADASAALDDILSARQGAFDPQTANEAATRLLLIDQILEKVLGWPLDEFNPEEFAGTREGSSSGKERMFLDYHLGTEGVPRLVVEAKRAGKTFELPTSKKDRVVNLGLLRRNHGKLLTEVLTQASDYCVRVGTPAFIVTNGQQWIASLAFAQHVAPDKLGAVVFYDLADLRQHLGLFYELFSPSGLAGQSLQRKVIAGLRGNPSFVKRLNSSIERLPFEGKNYFAKELAALMRQCFGDLTDNDHYEMLRDCYVTNDTTDAHTKRLEAFAGIGVPQTLPNGTTRLRRTSADPRALFDETRTDGESVLLVGKAGSGKSTFLAFVGSRFAPVVVDGKPDIMLLYVDLRLRTQVHAENFDHDSLIEDICTDVLDEAERSFPSLDPHSHQLLRKIFGREIQKLERSLSPNTTDEELERRVNEVIQQHRAQPKNHLKAYLGFLAREGIRALVLLDNVDRGTERFERVTYQLAQLLVQSTNAIVLTCLRDTTLQAGQTAGFLDVARHTVFTIAPPAFVDVARRRFDYLEHKLIRDPKLWRKLAPSIPSQSTARILDFAKILAELVLSHGDSLSECIQALAGTNIRRALELLEIFASSPHTDIEGMFKAYQSSRSGPHLDSFLRSVMRGAHARYEEKDSKIVNLFQVSEKSLASHFIAIRVLQFLRWQATRPREPLAIAIQNLSRELALAGYAPDEVLAATEHLGRHGLVACTSRPEPPWAPEDTVQLGTAGSFYLEQILWSREYVSNVVGDTLIYDETTFNTLRSLHFDKSLSVPERFDGKSLAFLHYLVRRERIELEGFAANPRPRAWLNPVAEDIGVRIFGTDFKRSSRQNQPPR